MAIRKSYLLLPCHSLEDFPTYHEGDEAEGLLAAWTALWHPALLAATGELPQWQRAEEAPAECQDALVVVPCISSHQLPTGFVERAESEGALVIVGETDRERLLGRVLERLGEVPPLAADRASDFLSLAYCFLQVELLTRQMRYTSNLDEVHFGRQTVAAAQAAVEGDVETLDRLLQHAFDLLAEERDHYYAVDAFLLDLTLLAPSTLGSDLEREIDGVAAPRNLLIWGELIESLCAGHPSLAERIARDWNEGRLGLVGGDPRPWPWPWMDAESVRYHLMQGREVVRRQWGRFPSVYGRYRFGLTPLLPLVLAKLGYTGALHATFDEGRTAAGSQAKVRWEAPDGTAIDAVARGILDASRPETFLGLALKLGEAMDMEHVATLTLAHWPDRTARWYDDLRRISRFGHPLGRFVTVEEYFGDDSYPGHLESLRTDVSVSPYLAQAVRDHRPSLLTRFVNYTSWRARLEAWKALEVMRAAWQGGEEGETERGASWQEQIDASLEADDSDFDAAVLDEAMLEAARALVEPLEVESEPGHWIVNPTSHARRVYLRRSDFDHAPRVERPVYAAESLGEETAVVVDVPAMGFVWLPADGRKAAPMGRRKKEPLLAEEWVLRNEFFEAHLDETTGGLRALHTYGERANRMSQQVALWHGRRFDPEHPHAGYSVMVADGCEVTAATHTLGEITTRGRLVDQLGETLASYQQIYRVWRGSRVLELEIDLEPIHHVTGDPWKTYYCVRFAWSDETWLLYRCVNDMRQSTDAKRIEAPVYLELNGVDERTTIFPCGLPFHRRRGLRMLDTLLTVPGEERRSFRLGIGIDVRQPWQQAQWLAAPPLVWKSERAPDAQRRAGWLFRLSRKHVSATSWEPLWREGRCVGVRVRLLETAGRETAVELHAFRPLLQAQQTDFRGEVESDCRVDEGVCHLTLAAHEWIQVDAYWEEVGRSSIDDHHD